ADLSFLSSIGFSKDDGTGVFVIPFLDRMGIIFIACLIGMWIISKIENKKGIKPKGLETDSKMFRVDSRFAIGAIIALGLLTALYIVYW
ncbi:MAG TPA: sodium transporter, partial [Chitinophagaceae bacterium]|nr:sodium transporter [Chitinophagaceae bacterium]